MRIGVWESSGTPGSLSGSLPTGRRILAYSPGGLSRSQPCHLGGWRRRLATQRDHDVPPHHHHHSGRHKVSSHHSSAAHHGRPASRGDFGWLAWVCETWPSHSQRWFVWQWVPNVFNKLFTNWILVSIILMVMVKLLQNIQYTFFDFLLCQKIIQYEQVVWVILTCSQWIGNRSAVDMQAVL